MFNQILRAGLTITSIILGCVCIYNGFYELFWFTRPDWDEGLIFLGFAILLLLNAWLLYETLSKKSLELFQMNLDKRKLEAEIKITDLKIEQHKKQKELEE